MIKPLGKYILIEMEQVKQVGNLMTDSKKTIQEWGKVIEIGPEVTINVSKGDTILAKGWAVDTITYEKQDYFFVSEDSGGICGIVTT